MTIAIPAAAIKDSHLKWSKNFQLAPSFNMSAYQDRIDAIAGFTQAKEPVLRLTWGGNESWWEAEGNEMIEKPRYAFQSRQQHNFGQLIPIRRFFIEENTDPGQLAAMGGKDGRIKAPEKGFYTPWIMIADHSKCVKDCDQKSICYGDYKEPSDAELDYIKEVTFRITADKYRADPRRMVVPEMIVPYLPKELDDKEQAEKDETENVEYIQSWMKTHGVARTQNSKAS